jgi:hypothetical protein
MWTSEAKEVTVYLSDSERETIQALASHLPEPGTRCPVCQRRINKPRKDDSPETREIRIKLPSERMEWAEEALDALQQVVGTDPYSYPRGSIFEALLILGGQQREQLRSLFQGDGA